MISVTNKSSASGKKREESPHQNVSYNLIRVKYVFGPLTFSEFWN